MKKFSLLLALILVFTAFALVACGSDDTNISTSAVSETDFSEGTSLDVSSSSIPEDTTCDISDDSTSEYNFYNVMTVVKAVDPAKLYELYKEHLHELLVASAKGEVSELEVKKLTTFAIVAECHMTYSDEANIIYETVIELGHSGISTIENGRLPDDVVSMIEVFLERE